MDNDFLNKAIDLSTVNLKEHKGGPFGCVITKDNQIISEGYNTVVNDSDPTAHAEINAIRKACKLLNRFDLSDCTIYSSCEPCPMCFSAIHWAKISKIFFANTRKDAANIGFSDDHIYSLIENKEKNMFHIPSDRAISIFQKWYNDDNKKNY